MFKTIGSENAIIFSDPSMVYLHSLLLRALPVEGNLNSTLQRVVWYVAKSLKVWRKVKSLTLIVKSSTMIAKSSALINKSKALISILWLFVLIVTTGRMVCMGGALKVL